MTEKLKITFNYYKLWNHKDIEKISDLFEETIILYNWDTIISGKDNVVNTFKQLFGNIEDSVAHIDDYAENNHNVFVKLSIMHNNEDNMNVLDVITFNLQNDKIIKIQSYKQ